MNQMQKAVVLTAFEPSNIQRLTKYVLRRVRNETDADDLVQEVYIAFKRALDADRETVIRDPLRYLFGIARNKVSDHLTQIQRSRVTFDSATVDKVSEQAAKALPDLLAEQLSQERVLRRALLCLPQTQRRVLQLTSIEGLSYDEAAAALEISVHTVKKFAYEAKAKLRIEMAHLCGEDL